MHEEVKWKRPVTYFRIDCCFEELECTNSRLLQIQDNVGKCLTFAKTENDTEKHPLLD